MPTAADYRWFGDGVWRLAVLPEIWQREFHNRVITLVCEQAWSQHPQTLEFAWAADGITKQYYLKVFHRIEGSGAVKDLFRPSKAFRFWRQGLALSAAGFNVPPTIAAGELRHFRLVERAFVLTAKLDGQSLPVFLTELAKVSGDRAALKIKRSRVRRLACLIREFHRLGFVHGDLVASNFFISEAAGRELTVYFMDNDRTRRYPSWFPQSLWKRNLIQLNRMPLPGITLQERMRFLRAYLGRSQLTRADRRFARWLEEKTRRRRKECDGVDPTVSFRKLMYREPDVPVHEDR